MRIMSLLAPITRLTMYDISHMSHKYETALYHYIVFKKKGMLQTFPFFLNLYVFDYFPSY